ncbi:MAG: hypothetical protein AAB509_03735 [Patescibacteria group bacterium]
MNASEEDVRNFDDLKTFVGQALKDARCGSGKTSKDLSETLRLRHGLVQATENWVSNIEVGTFHLLFEEFEILCQALNFSIKDVLERAQVLKLKRESVKK